MSVEATRDQHARAGLKRQIQLPWKKAFEISWKSIKIRFSRSLITAAGILLGIAFFTSVQMSSVFNGIQDQLLQEKIAAIKAGTYKPTPEDTRKISAASANPEEKQGAENRLRWLSIMALVVCTVGITNAMLMSVTERYKEIGTMKCLGALDSFIVKLFFIESCMLGFIASVLGFVTGWFIISLMHIGDGIAVYGATYWSSSLTLLMKTTLLGTCLTFLATIPPAFRAAKMPAAAALRVEI